MINSCEVNINNLPECNTCFGSGFQLNELVCDCCKKKLDNTKFNNRPKYITCEKCYGTGKCLFIDPNIK